MEKYVIRGGAPLIGEVSISGAKNAVVAILPAAVLAEGPCIIENIPNIRDVSITAKILQELGAEVRLLDKNTFYVDATHVNTCEIRSDLARKMRASYYFLGSLLGRFSKARVPVPGGCDFGVRPIDQHIKGFEALGAKVNIERGGLIDAQTSRVLGNHIYLDVVSVGATINIMLAAVKAKGLTIIENAAKEPHIVDLANFLNLMGADVRGAGTDVIKIRGVDKLRGTRYSIIPDQIEAGTFMVAAAATSGDVLIKNVIPKHLEVITNKLMLMGVEVIEYDDAVRVRRSGELIRTNIKTMPHPGYPTDMQPQTTILLTQANGTSVVTESVFDNRFKYIEELGRMGARIQVDGRVAVIDGPCQLTGAPVRAIDLRAGAALVIAGLIADGDTIIEDISHIERGYDSMEAKLRGLGACIKKQYQPDPSLAQAL